MAVPDRVAADIGGTFTDIALVLEDGTLAIRKVPSTPGDYAIGVVDGIRQLMAEIGRPLSCIAEVLHGCTIATNAILEGKGARTALVTTAGFGDILEMRRIRVPRLYDPLFVKPAPLVPRELRFEVPERMAADGTVLTALDEAEVRAVAERIRAADVEAVAVTFLHSYANPDHERRVGALLRDALPDRFITLSVDVLPEIREYERTSTTVINAYIGPTVSRYLRSLSDQLRAAGIGGRLLVMQSSGGILDAEAVIAAPARIIECGPAAGVIGCAHAAAAADLANVITFDMGGTTAKASMIEAGRLAETDEYEVGGGISLSNRLVKGGGYALKLPVIDISEVGAGGGSIVWFDKAGALKVGPHSAGASPGPACYPDGGSEPTVTDANVVLGYLSPAGLAGGTVPIDAGRARAVIADQVAAPLGGDPLAAAYGVFAVAVATMMRAVKAVSTYRGRDPREFALMAFGGNGGIFAPVLARSLGMTRVLVPPAAGVFSAVGLLVSAVSFSRSQAFLRRTDRLDPAELDDLVERLATEVAAVIGRPRDRLRLDGMAAMRYGGQAFELRIPLPVGPTGADRIAALVEGFEREHERCYGHRFTGEMPIELVTLQVAGAAVDGSAAAAPPRPALPAAPPASQRQAYFGADRGLLPTPVIARSALDRHPRPGPLIVEEYEGTTVVPPDATARLDDHGNIAISLEPSS